jgi:hypothetical protein
MKKKDGTIVLVTLICSVVLVGGGLAAFRWSHLQGATQPCVLRGASEDGKVALFTQKSPFKNAVLETVGRRVAPLPLTVSVLDVSRIAEAAAQSWDAVVILATNESGKLPPGVEAFLRESGIRCTLVVTAGSGKWPHAEGLDAITTASKSANVSQVAETIVSAIARAGK